MTGCHVVTVDCPPHSIAPGVGDNIQANQKRTSLHVSKIPAQQRLGTKHQPDPAQCPFTTNLRMGTGASKSTEDGGSHVGEAREESLDQAGGQLYVSLKMENYKLKGELIPHVYGSVPLVGSWDASKALPMERESASMWELSFVVPPNHETLDFKFLLRPTCGNGPCIVEEGPNRVLTGGTLQGDARLAFFRLDSEELLESRVFIKADRVSPFDLAASWRAYQENLQPSTVRGIPDVSINSVRQVGPEFQTFVFIVALQLVWSLILNIILSQLQLPSANSGQIYAANNTETPRSLRYAGVFSNAEGSGSVSHSGISADRPATIKFEVCPSLYKVNFNFTTISMSRRWRSLFPTHQRCILVLGMGESKSVGTFSPLQKQDSYRGLFVDRGVGSPRLVKSASASTFAMDLKLDNETNNSMPAAAGAVAAAAIADQMLGPKEDRHLAIVLVGLPARGKTFTAAKLTRYLRWLGHDTKHFNVGKYRRLKHGTNQVYFNLPLSLPLSAEYMHTSFRCKRNMWPPIYAANHVSVSADFFRADNPEGMEARNEVAALAMEDMISWMQEGGQVGIFDATNSMRERRNMLMKMAEGKCKIIFLETICNDRDIILRNIRLKIQQSPDYAEQPDFEAGLQDFKNRLANYEKVYEPVEEGSYIKMIDMVSGHGGQLQVNNISGYLPGRIVFFLVNTHLTPRPILLTRHGESRDNVRGRIGGDNVLRHLVEVIVTCYDSDKGEIYAKKLANFVEKRLKSERAASIWTSTLQRTILTASPIVGFPKIQWRALDEINAGVCDGMTYEEIRKNMPEEYELVLFLFFWLIRLNSSSFFIMAEVRLHSVSLVVYELWSITITCPEVSHLFPCFFCKYRARKKDKLRYRYPRGESYLDVIQRLEPVIIELERQRAPVVVISHQAVLRALYAYFADRPLKEIPHIEMPLHTIIEIQMGVTGVQEKRYKLMD
ncbi:hypothetical protein Patl1_31064 [Pistacia atlantica]|uniref:Uncharacterized protein n=1 Tax=Pistacia atlantica TaxID=434234 RepID=A0ACC1ACA7_9ROSI|nr:hypothetical protein Patl1_31064 [Pistacia atlantica]